MNEPPIDRRATDSMGAPLCLEAGNTEDFDQGRESLRGATGSPSRKTKSTTDAYLAVLGRGGVVRLDRETEHAARFLARRCYRATPYRETLWWATLTPEAAETIRYLAESGWGRLALECFSQEARQLGSLPPTDTSHADSRPAA